MKSDTDTDNNPWISSLPNDWEYRSLEDLCFKVVDNRGKTVPTADSGIALIATNCIKKDKLFPIYEKVRYVSQEIYATWFRDHPEPGDIIFVNKGTPGLVCMVPDPVDFCIAQDMVAIRPNKKIVDAKYLFAALRSNYFQEQVKGFHVGTLIPHLKKGDFRELIVPLPPKELQSFIGNCYYDISLEITLYEKLNSNLQNIIQCIFKSWFIDFDGQTEFVDSELGAIPKGWKIMKFSEIATVLGGGTPRTRIPEYWGGNVKWVSVVDTEHEPYIIETEKMITDLGVSNSSAKMLPFETIVITARGTVGNCSMMSESMTINQSCYGLRGKDGIGQIFLFHLLKTNLRFFLTNVHGTVFDTITRSTFDTIEVIKPAPELINKFERISRPFFDKILRNQSKIRILSKIRDSLLSKLMSGEIRP